MDWNICSNLDPIDETLNFGTRAYAESDGCIYEITTLATFVPDDEISSVPSLCFGSIGNMFVCVGNTLTTFADEFSSPVLFTMAFDAPIETFACSIDGNFLIVGLSNGFVQFLHIPSGEQVYVKKLEPHGKGGRMFVKIIVDENFAQDVLIVCASGDVMNFFDIDFPSLHLALEAKDTSRIRDIVSLVTLAPFCGPSAIAPIRHVTTLTWNNQLVLFAVGSGIATLHTGWGSSCEAKEWHGWHENVTQSTFVKVESTSDNLFLALNAAGQLLLVCPYTLLMRRLPTNSLQSISDFKLVESSSSDVMIVAVTNCSEITQTNLCMLSYPACSVKFSLPIGEHSVLTSRTCNVEDIHFLEYVRDKASDTSTVALKSATQTVPKFRLERLLMRRKFEAAESLARNFNLSMTPVHIARVKYLLNQMQPWNQNQAHATDENKELLKSILNELDKISDLDFVSNCCVSAVAPDYHVAHSLLEYAQSRLELFFVNNPELETKILDWSGKVCSSMLRLETLNLLRTSWDVEEWLEFSRCDLLQEVHSWIKQGALTEASVIWSRHKSSFKGCLANEQLTEYLLEDIPAWVSLSNILEWLAHVLPFLLEVQPKALPKIVLWILSKISDLERSHNRDWPKIGLDYTEKTLALMSSQNFASPFVGVEASPLRPLVVLRSALASLFTLRSEYYIFISLEDFSMPPADVALLLLHNIDLGSISTFVSKYFNNYVLDHKLESDVLISQYIMIVLESADGWWHWEEAPWESRITTLIPFINNLRIRLECTVDTLETAPVPWSTLISGLADDGLKLKHPLTSSIREKQKQVGTNLILKKYNLKAHINKIDRNRLLKYVVKQNHDDMLADLEELAHKSVESYKIVVMQLFYLGNTSKALDVIKSLPCELVVQICPWVIQEITLILSSALSGNIVNQLEFISAIALCHDAAIKLKPPGLSHIEDLPNPKYLPLPLEELKNWFLLNRDFSKHLSITDMGNIVCRRKVLTEIIQDMIMQVVEDESLDGRNIRLYRQAGYVARLLSIPAAESFVELIEQAMHCSDVTLALYIAGCFDCLRDLPLKVYEKLARLPLLFLQKFLDDDGKVQKSEVQQEASETLYRIVSCICSNCDHDFLFEALKTFGWMRVWHSLSGQREVSLFGLRDAFLCWRFTPLYNDPGLAGFLNRSILYNFFYSFFNFINFVQEPQDDFLSKCGISVKKLQNDQLDVSIIMIFSQALSCLQQCTIVVPENTGAWIRETLSECFQALLPKVAGTRQFDKHLGLGLLSGMGQVKALKHLEHMSKSAHVDFHRQKAFSWLGTVVTGIWRAPEKHHLFKHLSIQSTWGLRLSELGFQVKDLLRGKPDADTILQKLIGSKDVTSSLFQSLCADYQLDYQEVLLQHLCAVLLSWDPDPSIKVNTDGTKDVIVKNSQQQLLDQCWKLANNIKHKSLLCNTLASLWKKVNFYHHEIFLVILEILERHGITDESNKRLINSFLKRYRRVKPPDQAEEDFWIQLFPSSFGLPLMSEFRLPFSRRLTDTPFQALSNEFNLKTFREWLPIAAALDLSKDRLCMKAVHQTVTEEFTGHQSSHEWFESPKNEALIESVADCVSLMDDVTQAAATLYFFMNKLPAGYDQVKVANICMQYADILLKETGNTEYKLKVEKKYFYLATLQTLHVYGLGQPCYTQLAQKPVDLIQMLYQHPSILDLCRGTASYSLDINAAVKDISALHSTCLKTLHMDLVSEWLQPDIIMNCNTSMDDDILDGMELQTGVGHISNSSNGHVADDNILRARYVMEHGNANEWASFLIDVVYGGEASIGMRLRAMQCLLMLTEDETLEELSGRSMPVIREKLRTLKYLRDLQVLGLTYSESGFECCDKMELANLVLRAQSRCPQALSFLVQLCIDYEVSSMSIWDSIFNQLVDREMVKELEQALSFTLELYQLWTLRSFRKAWNLILTLPFLKGTCNFEKNRDADILHVLTLYPTCPVLKYIDVSISLENCLISQRPELAALLLPYIEKSEVPHVKEKLFACKNQESVIEDIKTITFGQAINVTKVLKLLTSDAIQVRPENIV